VYLFSLLSLQLAPIGYLVGSVYSLLLWARHSWKLHSKYTRGYTHTHTHMHALIHSNEFKSNPPKKHSFRNREFYLSSKQHQMRADIARYEILNSFGGLYLDCDMLWVSADGNTRKFAINCTNYGTVGQNYFKS
jgi:mannosyltransferase OCH1-like enzyme